MEIVSRIAMISINETLIIQLVSFLIFLFLINRVMFRPLKGVMDERDQYLQTVQKDITDAEGELTRVKRMLLEQEKATRAKANEMKREIEEQGSQEAARMFASARKEITDLKDRTEDEIEADLNEAKKHLRTESEALALRIMEKILNRRVA